MLGWHDFRRVSQDDSTRATRQAVEAEHAFLHQHGMRHHHNAGDSSVVKDDAALVEEGATSELAQFDAGTVYIKAALTPDIASAVEIFRSQWITPLRPSITSPRIRRIERPPQGSLV